MKIACSVRIDRDISQTAFREALRERGFSVKGMVSSVKVRRLSVKGSMARFSVFPGEFVVGMSQLRSVEIDDNPFEPWEIPQSLKNASSLQNLSANSANMGGVFVSLVLCWNCWQSFMESSSIRCGLSLVIGVLPIDMASLF